MEIWLYPVDPSTTCSRKCSSAMSWEISMFLASKSVGLQKGVRVGSHVRVVFFTIITPPSPRTRIRSPYSEHPYSFMRHEFLLLHVPKSTPTLAFAHSSCAVYLWYLITNFPQSWTCLLGIICCVIHLTTWCSDARF